MCCSVAKRQPSGTFDHGLPKEGDQDRQGLKDQDEHDRAKQEEQARDEEELQRLEQEKRVQEARESEEREEEVRRQEAARARERQDAEEAEQERQRQAEEQRKNREKEDRISKVQEWMKTHGFSGEIGEINIHKTSGGCCSASSTTPLHLAAQKKDHEMVELMVKSGARVDELDGKKRTPEAVAKRCNKKGSHDAVLEKLRDPQLQEEGASA
jgi:phage-related minor tail protein